MRRPVRIGVTGGIGSGKSTLVEALRSLGCVVFSADAAVHELYRSDPDVRDAVVNRWGDRVLAADGSIDRSAIADIVFHDEGERRWLESVLHPLVAREWLRFVHDMGERDPAPPAIVAEVPLLFEANLEDRYDLTVLVTAPLELRLARAGERAQGASHAAQRAAVQIAEEEKAARADVVIDNAGNDPAALTAAAIAVLDAALSRT